LPPLGKPRLALQFPTCSQLNGVPLQSIYLLSAYSILPGSGSYIVNIGMLLLSVRIGVLEQIELSYELTKFLFICRVCIQRSSLLSSAHRSVKMRTPLGQNARTGWISRQLNFQLAQPRLRAVNSRPHIVEGKRLRCLSLPDGSAWTETDGNFATHGLLIPTITHLMCCLQ